MPDDLTGPAATSELLRHYWLYVLRLEQGKYYVGITTKSVEARFQEHERGAAYWTKKYKPLEIIETEDLGMVTEAQAEQVENEATIECMEKYGAENVQGGKYTDRNDVFVLKFRKPFKSFEWTALTSVLGLFAIVCVLVAYILSR